MLACVGGMVVLSVGCWGDGDAWGVGSVDDDTGGGDVVDMFVIVLYDMFVNEFKIYQNL